MTRNAVSGWVGFGAVMCKLNIFLWKLNKTWSAFEVNRLTYVEFNKQKSLLRFSAQLGKAWLCKGEQKLVIFIRNLI